jgi:hypothetical protein
VPADPRAPTWAELGARARAWRLVHALWSVAQLACLGLIWARVVQRRRDPAGWGAVAFLGAEGSGLLLGRGDCPMGRVQEGWGDPVPFFELLLPPRAAKAAVPTLAAVAVAAIAALVLRRPGLVLRSPAGDAWARDHADAASPEAMR